MRKNTVMLCLLAIIIVGAFSSCNKKEYNTETSKKINVVTTIFPAYDFLRQIGGDRLNLTMLLKPGAESHSFEPSPQDIIKIQQSDLFVYVGGDSDSWVKRILDSMNKNEKSILTLMDCVTLVEEKLLKGMEADEEESDVPEMDEHVWTSPANVILIVNKLCDKVCQLDPENQAYYRKNAANYIVKLTKLDQELKEIVDTGKRKEIILGDRFPFRYFAEAYGLTCYAAFPGCSTETEPSAKTVAFLIDKVKKDKIPVVFHIELSNEKMCDSIAAATGAKKALFHAIHNISQSDFDSGVTYLDLMKKNEIALKEALN